MRAGAPGGAGAQVPAAVALVGFMGAGKTAVGRALAAKLDLPFVDTDDLIEAEAGPIAGIFAARGEAGFRALEEAVVTAAVGDARRHPCVLALGGGAVLSSQVRGALRQLTSVVWLTAPAPVLWARVAAAGTAARPLAADEEAFTALLSARGPLYREVATAVVDTAQASPEEVASGLASRQVALTPATTTREGGR